MTKRACLKCGKRCGKQCQIEGIRMTVCCPDCCEKFIIPFEKRYQGQYRYPERLARKNYGCSKKDLSELHSIEIHYPDRKKQVRLYLGSEVECIGARRNLLKWKEQCSRKTKELQSKLGISLKRVPPLLKFFILGDYCRRFGVPVTSAEDIWRRYSVVERVQRILTVQSHAHPMAAFDFCIQYPSATTEGFRELKEKTQKVFRLEGSRILRFLTPEERDRLKGTPLKDCVEEFDKRDKEALVRGYMSSTWDVEPSLARKIVSHEACQLRIRREDDEREIARKLLLFWEERHCVEQRRSQLSDAFRAKAVPIHPISSPQKRYIYGLVDCDAEEIAGVQQISSGRHFPLIANDRLERVSIAVAQFERNLCSRKLPYEESVRDAIQFARSVPLATFREIRASWDFSHLKAGYWSDQWYVL